MTSFNQLAEEELLKSILLNANDCEWALSNIQSKHFYNQKNKALFERIEEVLKQGKEINIVSIGENWKGDLSHMMELAGEAFSAAGSKEQAEAVLNLYYKREGQRMLVEAQKHVQDIECTPDTLRERVEQIAYFLSERSNQRGLVSLNEIAKETLDEFEEISKGGRNGISTGLKRPDELGWTFRPGTFSVIGARPAMGKSALALDVAQNCGVPVAFYSLEMKGIEQFERLLGKKMGVENSKLRSPTFIQQHGDSIARIAMEVSKTPIYINDAPTISPMQLRMQVKRAIAKYGVKLVIVDYMGYIDDGQKSENRRIEMGRYSRAMKNIAKDLDVATVGLCQLNRDCESRDNKRPILADLRETGDIEQDADMVWFVYRGAVYEEEVDKMPVPDNLAELICRKKRAGKIGTVKLEWNGRLTRFRDWEANDEQIDWTSQYD